MRTEIDESELRHLYVTERMTQEQLADHFKISRISIRRRLALFNIPLRPAPKPRPAKYGKKALSKAFREMLGPAQLERMREEQRAKDKAERTKENAEIRAYRARPVRRLLTRLLMLGRRDASIARDIGVSRTAVHKWRRGEAVPTEAHMAELRSLLAEVESGKRGGPLYLAHMPGGRETRPG